VKQLLPLIVLILIASAAHAEQKAITDTGEEIVIYEDGTWKYLNEATAATDIALETNPETFTKSATASFLVKSKKNRAAFWLDTNKWQFKPAAKNDEAEYELTLKGEDLYGLFLTEKMEIPMETLTEIALENAKAVAPDIHITRREFRIVNGRKVIYMEMSGSMKGMKITYLGCYHSDASGTTQFLAYTGTNLVGKYRKEIKELLNGFDLQ